MHEGNIVEFGDPQHLYNRPQTPYGAQFIGVSNRFEGTAVGTGEVEFMQVRVPRAADSGFSAGDPLAIFIRPESIALARTPRNGHGWAGRIANRIFQGDCWDYTVRVNDREIRVRSYDKAEQFQTGDTAYLLPDYNEMIVLPHHMAGAAFAPPVGA
jgi:iron(III) transport system ATP-binding protein